MPARVIGLIVGNGTLPDRVMETLFIKNIAFKVVILDDFAAPSPFFDKVEHIRIKLGQAGSAIAFLKKHGISEILMIGGVKRPSLLSLFPDFWTAKFLAKVGFKALGDDGMLKAITDALHNEGFTIIGVQDIMDNILAKSGVYGSISPNKQDMADINRATEILKTLSPLDIGQGLVIQQGLVLAVEAIEGTDMMLNRIKSLKREGNGPILVKMKKVGQHEKLDLPTIGSSTVEAAAKNGIRGIAIHAGGALIADYDEMVKKADAAGIFIYGYDL